MARMRGVLVALGLTLCAALGLAAPAVAAGGSISGTVKSADTDEGIEGIYVCANSPNFGVIGGCTGTDADGNYKIDGLQANWYSVSFEEEGRKNYVAQWYRLAAHREDALGVQVGPDQEVTGIDAELETGGQVTGRVTDVETGSPIEFVEVCAPQIDSVEEIRTIHCDRTDSEGNYTVQALPTGNYKIEFGTTPGSLNQVNYIHQYFPAKSRWDEAEVRSISAGSTWTGVDAAMQRGVEISGTVTDTSGAPVVWQSRICALDAGSEAIVQCAPPEKDGIYRIGGLPFGSYKVSFGVDVEDEPGLVLRPDGFLPQYYNGKPTFAAADTLSSAGPNVFTGIDARLERGDDPVKPLPPVTGPDPSLWASPPTVKPRKQLRCKKGFRKQRVKGKPRCVKVHKKHGKKKGSRKFVPAAKGR
jgi:hypothetical protein